MPTEQLSHKMLLNLRASAIMQGTPSLNSLAFSDRAVRTARQRIQLRRARAIGGLSDIGSSEYTKNIAEYVAMREICNSGG